MDVVDAGDLVIGQAPAPTAVVTDNGPCFRGLRHVRARARSPQTNGVIERLFGTLQCEHLYRAIIGDGNALDDRTPRQAYLTGLEST